MNTDALRKLRRHIERTGLYEPLTTRPHPTELGRFQIINGNNRLHVLRALGCETALCAVWDIGDDQARLLLATLNRLSGNDIPERRAVLLENLLTRCSSDELSKLVPERIKDIKRLESLARLELDESPPVQGGDRAQDVSVMVSVTLSESEATEVNLALELILNASGEQLSRGQALAKLAASYIGGLEFRGSA